MRNLGILIILVLFGMSLWRAADRNRLVSSEPVLESNQAQVKEATRPERVVQPRTILSAEEPSPQKEQPEAQEQTVLEAKPVILESGSPAVKTLQKPSSPVANTKSFERVVIPSLKLNASLVSKSYSDVSWDLSSLGQDIAQLANIPNQTSENNIVLAGHVTVFDGSNGPFRYLWKMNPGEQVILRDEQHIYTYAVREQLLVYPDEISVLEDTATPQLTLITCTTWDEATLSYLRRRVIVADLVNVESRQVLLD
jgi:LPXTG-site transpeptidase (sortase) family protein